MCFRPKKLEPDSPVSEKTLENSSKHKKLREEVESPKRKKPELMETNSKRSRKISDANADITDDQKIPPKKRKANLLKVQYSIAEDSSAWLHAAG